MEEKDIIAGNLELYRKKASLSQLDLAKKLNYSNKNISKWENGETTPNIFILNKIAKLYGITVDDLLNEATVDKQNQVSKKAMLDEKKKNIFRLSMLALANAILFMLGTISIYILGLINIDGFNMWLIYLYLTPLSILSILIYIRIIYNYVSFVCVSLFGWLICLSIYVSLLNVYNIWLIFVLGVAYQLIAIFVTVLVNIKLSTKFHNIFDKILKRRKIK